MMVLMNKTANYQDLLAGVETFPSRVVQKDQGRYGILAKTQSPRIAFVTCSDSRIDPCAMTDTQPGDLFVIRNAGNLVPTADGGNSGEIATLEFAVKALKVQSIVVCGHSDCGAMKGLISPEACSHLHHVANWVTLAKPALAGVEVEKGKTKPDLNAVIESNVQLQLENLRKLDFIREAEESGNLSIHGWVYNVGTGIVQVIEGDQSESLQHVA